MNVVVKEEICKWCAGEGTQVLVSEDEQGFCMDVVDCRFCIGRGTILRSETKEVEIDDEVSFE